MLTELPCGFAPTKWRFLQRNRIIAAYEASGLSRDDYAARVQGRDEATNALVAEALAEADALMTFATERAVVARVFPTADPG